MGKNLPKDPPPETAVPTWVIYSKDIYYRDKAVLAGLYGLLQEGQLTLTVNQSDFADLVGMSTDALHTSLADLCAYGCLKVKYVPGRKLRNITMIPSNPIEKAFRLDLGLQAMIEAAKDGKTATGCS